MRDQSQQNWELTDQIYLKMSIVLTSQTWYFWAVNKSMPQVSNY